MASKRISICIAITILMAVLKQIQADNVSFTSCMKDVATSFCFKLLLLEAIFNFLFVFKMKKFNKQKF